MKKRIDWACALALAIGGATLLAGCGGGERTKSDKLRHLKRIAAKAEAERQTIWNEMVKGGPVRLQPVSFPNQTHQLDVGQTVFGPHPDALSRSQSDTQRRLSYGAYEVVTVGKRLVGLKPRGFRSPTADQVKALPHGWLLPLPASESVVTGDLVLATWNQLQMGHMIVIQGGANPRARMQLLDKVVDLKPGCFIKLADAWQPGTWAAISQSGRIERAMIVAVNESRVLTTTARGAKVFNKDNLAAIPPRLDVKVGERVWGYALSSAFRPGILRSIDNAKAEYVIRLDSSRNKDQLCRIPYGCLTTEDLSRLAN